MRLQIRLFTILLCLSSHSSTAETVLNVKPAKCVAMNKGQICYQQLRFQFTAPQGDYCLVSKSQKTPLKCWRSAAAGEHQHPFQSDSDIDYRLINEHDVTVANASVVVAWVYRKSRARNRWRLF